MQTFICLVGIVFTAQVAGSAGDRYAQSVLPPGSETPSAVSTPFADTPSEPTAQQPFAPPADNPLRVSPSPPNQPASSPPFATTSPSASTPPASTPQATSAAPARLTKVQKPADLLKNLLTPAEQQKLAGSPFSLADAVQGTQSRLQQSQRVALYWDLSKAVSDYYLTVREELDLQSQRNGLLQADREWDDAQAGATARRKTALGAVKVAQLRLQKACGRAGGAALPVPSDLPHCGAYQSKYDKIFQGRTSREAEQLANLLPLRHRQLTQLSTETTDALNWHSRVSQQRGAQDGATLLLKAYEQLALQRRAFVSAAYQYNSEIARYTELAVPQDVAPVRLVAMLIQTDAKWQEGAIRRASALESGGSGSHPPRTFSSDGRSQRLRVPTGDATDERSILVQPGSDAK